MWSIGCILFELLQATKLMKMEEHNPVLFPGNSCYPLSPIIDREESQKNNFNKLYVDKDDQLIKIVQKLSDLDNHDLSFISDEKGREYVEIIGKKPGVCRNELKDIYDDKTIDPDLKTVLNNLLQLNPYLRWSPRECLRLPTFDEFRIKEMESVKG